ncbi:MAG: HD domain-containing phosphohydrolase [Mariprofundaceae bacterium]|nr:HD domain-containing phosphohydrolase [Mariprofundaceae bacterium]
MKTQGLNKDNVNEALLALVGALEARDLYSKDHSMRVAQFVQHLTGQFRISDQQKKIIYNAALLHDIGVVSIPDAVLLKKGRLSPDERQCIQQAPRVAAKILASITSLSEEREIILHHGERWDGHGYPDQLQGEQIPQGSRFIAIAKAVDAMTKNRAYRRARPLSYCLEQLNENAGSQFDPKIAGVAARILCKIMPPDGV